MTSPAPTHPIPWGASFLPGHCHVGSPAFHWELADLLDSPSRLVAACCPRGHGKTTVTDLLWILHGAAHRLFRYALLIADTQEQAAQYLDEIRHECEDNEILLAAYPGLSQGPMWSRTDVIFANGARIQALGRGQKVRGRKHRGHRPDLVILDDVENDEAVETLHQRQKLRRWFYGAVIPALGPEGRVRVVGTILHRDSLLSRLLRTRGWTRRIWRAVQHDGTALWPAWRSAERLLREKEDAKAAGLLDLWYQEYQGVSMAPEGAAFKPEDITYFDSLPDDARFYKSLYVDPAISKRDSADWTGYTVVYASHDGIWYVVEAFRRRHDPAEVLAMVRRLHEKHRLDTIGIESVAYQKALVFWAESDAQARLEYLPVEAVTPDGDKRRRILGLQPFYRAHRIVHRSGLGSRLEEELLNLDDLDHEDLADSLAGHLSITIRPEPPKMRAKKYADLGSDKAAKHRDEFRRLSRLKRRGIDLSPLGQDMCHLPPSSVEGHDGDSG